MTYLIRHYSQRVGKILLWISLFSTPLQSAHGAKFSEDQVKAVYLINFAEFIRWPDNAFSEHPKQFHFCALQIETPVISMLKKVIVNESSRGRKFIFRQINNQEELKYCQIIYFHNSDQSRFIDSLPLLEKNSILTVSDDKAFIKNGGMIAIIRSHKRLRPTINVKRLEKTGLKASAKLLELANIVENN